MLTTLLIASLVLEGFLFAVPFVWKRRRWLVSVPLVLNVFAATGLCFLWWNIFGGLLLLTGTFRLTNHLRIAQGRMHERYLLKATRRTGIMLGGMQTGLLIGGMWWGFTIQMADLMTGLAVLQILIAGGILLTVSRNIVKTRSYSIRTHYSDKELPTLTVAIPARNETTDLEACLRSVLASDYPKLEILVLDDCSQDKTAEIIRSFAHDGVRFVQGVEPQERWLAKNQAYDKLADEANGELILFCGVDVRFGPQAIRALVSSLLSRQKTMISIMPRRFEGHLKSAFLQPMRYWWELALPRRYFNRPAVLSTCWLIRRKALKQMGGFEAVQHAIIPEGYFARELVKQDGYSFLRADNELAVQTEKKLADQYETAIRMHYPQIRRRPEIALLLTIIQLTFMLGPFLLAASTIWAGFGHPQALALIACTLLILANVLITHVTSPVHSLVAVCNLPVSILVELTLGIISMWKYEFSVVEWKGRNICVPVMHVHPRLPQL